MTLYVLGQTAQRGEGFLVVWIIRTQLHRVFLFYRHRKFEHVERIEPQAFTEKRRICHDLLRRDVFKVKRLDNQVSQLDLTLVCTTIGCTIHRRFYRLGPLAWVGDFITGNLNVPCKDGTIASHFACCCSDVALVRRTTDATGFTLTGIVLAQLDSRRLLQSVVRLTEKPDVRAFELSLLVTLNELVVAKNIKLCKIHQGPEAPDQKIVVYVTPRDDTTTEDEPFETALVESDEDFVACLQTGHKTVTPSAQGSGVRIVHALKTDKAIVGFLIIECDAHHPKDQELVVIMLGFYKNYVSLLAYSQHDQLTGLLNRKTFDETVVRIIASQRSPHARSSDGHGGYCLAILDIDHFKRVNDQFGHLYGDEVLLLFARTMIEAFRGEDLLFRIGGEEFVVVLKDVDLARALVVLERFRQTVEAFSFPQVGTLTASVGATVISGEDIPISLIDRADRALYFAKNNGRNRVCAFENLLAEGKLTVTKDESNVELF